MGTAPEISVSIPHLAIKIKVLISNCQQLTTKTMENNIIKLTQYNNIDGIRKAIEEGADVNIQDEGSWTALMMASCYNKFEIVKLLIEAGADVNIQDKNRATALIIASLYNYVETVKLLIEEGADRDIKDKHGKTALDYAKQPGTPLDYAKRPDNQRIVELLTNLKQIKVKVKVIVPTSKVIQINTNEKGGDLIQTALCEDGSVWIYVNKKWISILNNLTN